MIQRKTFPLLSESSLVKKLIDQFFSKGSIGPSFPLKLVFLHQMIFIFLLKLPVFLLLLPSPIPQTNHGL